MHQEFNTDNLMFRAIEYDCTHYGYTAVPIQFDRIIWVIVTNEYCDISQCNIACINELALNNMADVVLNNCFDYAEQLVKKRLALRIIGADDRTGKITQFENHYTALTTINGAIMSIDVTAGRSVFQTSSPVVLCMQSSNERSLFSMLNAIYGGSWRYIY